MKRRRKIGVGGKVAEGGKREEEEERDKERDGGGGGDGVCVCVWGGGGVEGREGWLTKAIIDYSRIKISVGGVVGLPNGSSGGRWKGRPPKKHPRDLIERKATGYRGRER